MITFTANIRSASAATDDAITTSSVGIPVTLDLSADFDGLAKTLCFKTPSAAVDIALTGDATESAVPPDVLVRSGEWLNIGIYAADSNGDIVIPTVWANAGVIQLGTIPSGVDPSAPTPSWVAQVQQMAGDALNNSEQAIDTANEAKEAAITAQDSARASAAAAAQSATDAESAEMAAANSAGDAAASATAASGSVQIATEKASEAAASAAAAGTASDTATGKAVEAAQSADSAAQSAETAQNSAQAAQSAQTAAAGSALTASEKASEAAQSATQAGNSASEASASATAAQAAQTAAEAAQTAAEQAAQSISDAAAQIQKNTDDILSIYPTDTAGGSIATFADGADGVPVKSLLVNIEPVQSGTGDPSPENVRPISGWDAVNVQRTRKNILPITSYDGAAYNPAVGSTLNLTVSPESKQFVPNEDKTVFTVQSTANNQTWTLLAALVPNSPHYLQIEMAGETRLRTTRAYLDKDFKVLARTNNTSDPQTVSGPMQIPNGAVYYAIIITNSTGTTELITITQPQIEIGTVATGYEPYEGDRYPIDLPQTVYGGTLDVTSGVLTVDKVLLTFSGGATSEGIYGDDNAELYGLEIPDYNTIRIVRAQSTVSAGKISSNYFKFISTTSAARMKDTEIRTQAANIPQYLYFRWDSATDVSAINAAFANTPLQVICELQSPQTYQLTPTEVKTLLGLNNIWADAGDVDVTYRADVGLYVNKKTAQTLTAAASMLSNVETGMTATRAYAVNDFLSVNGQLYRVTAAIANGATITPGTNVTETTVGAQITALLNA